MWVGDTSGASGVPGVQDPSAGTGACAAGASVNTRGTHPTKGGYYGYLDWPALRLSTYCPYLPGGNATHLGFRVFLRVRETIRE